MQERKLNCLLTVLFRVLLPKIIISYKMINVYNCGFGVTKEEIKILLESLKPGQMLPLLNDWLYPEGYQEQLIYKNYLDRLLEGYTLKA